ncbi:transposable element Tcb1 transposase [Trichonephila clavipes]|nr:transposable element Tcb1 transposase [Trichonephila clavipes]
MAYLGSGPLWNYKETDPNCQAYWWWNLLYFNNFLTAANQCIPWSWYLANDMQFYVLSPLFMVTLLSATDQSQQCHSDYSGLYRRNRMQEKLRFCSHAFLPRSTNQSGHSLPGRPTHIRPHTLSRYGMEERFAFHFPVTPSIIHSENIRKTCGGVYSDIDFHCYFLSANLETKRFIRRPKGHDHWLSGQGWKHFETAEFVNCSRATVVKVYHAWQNGTVQNQGRGKCGAPRAIDDRGERRLRRCVRADRRATVEQLTTKMNQGATKSVSQTTIQRTLLRLGLEADAWFVHLC